MHRLGAGAPLPNSAFPHTLKEIGVDESVLPEAAKMAEHDPSNGGNPVPLTAKDYDVLFRNAINGVL